VEKCKIFGTYLRTLVESKIAENEQSQLKYYLCIGKIVANVTVPKRVAYNMSSQRLKISLALSFFYLLCHYFTYFFQEI
jgi:hypothetical protein